MRAKDIFRTFIFKCSPCCVFAFALFLSLNYASFDALLLSVKVTKTALYLAGFIVTLPTFIGFVAFVLIAAKTYKVDKITDYVIELNGRPGTGKSTLSKFYAVMYAKLQWKKLQAEYFLWSQCLASRYANNPDKLKYWERLERSYLFWKSSPCFKCLYYFGTMTVDGLKVNQLKIEHAAQIEALPMFSVLLWEEAGVAFGNYMSHNKDFAVSDFFRLIRHFKMMAIFCEQEPSNLYIDIRRVAESSLMLKTEWVLKPSLLLALIDQMNAYIVKRNLRSESLADFINAATAYANKIGFFRLQFIPFGNTELGNFEGSRRRTAILNRVLPYTASDIEFFDLYQCKNEKIAENVPNSDVFIDAKSPIGAIFTRESRYINDPLTQYIIENYGDELQKLVLSELEAVSDDDLRRVARTIVQNAVKSSVG